MLKYTREKRLNNNHPANKLIWLRRNACQVQMLSNRCGALLFGSYIVLVLTEATSELQANIARLMAPFELFFSIGQLHLVLVVTPCYVRKVSLVLEHLQWTYAREGWLKITALFLCSAIRHSWHPIYVPTTFFSQAYKQPTTKIMETSRDCRSTTNASSTPFIDPLFQQSPCRQDRILHSSNPPLKPGNGTFS